MKIPDKILFHQRALGDLESDLKQWGITEGESICISILRDELDKASKAHAEGRISEPCKRTLPNGRKLPWWEYWGQRMGLGKVVE